MGMVVLGFIIENEVCRWRCVVVGTGVGLCGESAGIVVPLCGPIACVVAAVAGAKA